MEERFNLIDEHWIPIADRGLVSLKEVFEDETCSTLGGNPIQKLAAIKLLQAIAQAAITPADNDEWASIGSRGMAEASLAYLEKWRDRFFLYGPRPFLQMPAISAAKIQPYGGVIPEVSTGNTTVLSQIQQQKDLIDAEKAMLLLTLMGFALSGKKTDNSIVLSKGFVGKQNDKGKTSSSKPGSSLGHMGFLHNFLVAASLRETVFLNLLTAEQIESINVYPAGVGIPPWESMPQGEDCSDARALKRSLMGRLIPMGRFCLLSEKGLHYSEGIAHDGYKSGLFDPSMAVDYSGKDPKALWTDPEKRPWRALTSLLSFFDQTGSKGFQSWQLVWALDRVRDVTEDFAIWSAGLRVSANAGEQYASGSDDYVDSTIWLHSGLLGESWFLQLRREMEALDALSKALYGRVNRFYKELMVDGNNQAAMSTRCFWELSEDDFQNLINACGNAAEDAEKRRTLRRRADDNCHAAFNSYCAKDTARQLDAWAKHRPNNSQYLKEEVK